MYVCTCVVSCVFVNVFCVSFLCVSEVEVVLPFCSFLYLSMAGMLYTIIPCTCCFEGWHERVSISAS